MCESESAFAILFGLETESASATAFVRVGGSVYE
jgi:hypothetical protein